MESRGRGVLDTPLEPVIGLAEGETWWRGMTTLFVERAVRTNASHDASSPRKRGPITTVACWTEAVNQRTKREAAAYGSLGFAGTTLRNYAAGGFSLWRCDRVKISTPSAVTPTECSNCADSERSRVTAVQPSDRIFTCGLPRLIIGSMVKNMPGFRVTPSPGRPL